MNKLNIAQQTIESLSVTTRPINAANSKLMMSGLILFGGFLAFGAIAVTAPAAGAFGYDLYDVTVNDILKGPVGFVGGVFGIGYSATKLSENFKTALLGVVGSSCVLQADNVVATMGLLV